MHKMIIKLVIVLLFLCGIMATWIYRERKDVDVISKVSLAKRLYLDFYEEAIKNGSFPSGFSKLEEYPAYAASKRSTKNAFRHDLSQGLIFYYPENGNKFLRKSHGDEWSLVESDSDEILMRWEISEGRIDCSVRGAVKLVRRDVK